VEFLLYLFDWHLLLLVVGLVAIHKLSRWRIDSRPHDRYKLNIKLFHQNKGYWSREQVLTDLVQDKNCTSLFSWMKKSQRLEYLHICSAELVNRDLDVQPVMWRLSLLHNLKQLEARKFYLSRDSILQQITVVKDSLLSSLDKALDGLGEGHPKYFEAYHLMQEASAQPITELNPYLKESGHLDVVKFVKTFDEQVKTNIQHLHELEHVCTTLTKSHLNNITLIIGQSNELNLSLVWDEEKVQVMHTKLGEITKNLTDMLEYIDGRSKFVANILCNTPLVCFKHTRVLHFLNRHKESLSAVFAGNEPPAFRVSIVHLSTLTDNQLQIHNVDEWRKVKTHYDQLLSIAKRIAKSIPSHWPFTVSNLSTHDGKPNFTVDCQEDFLRLMAAYAEYQQQLENVNKGLMYQFKVFINALTHR